MTDGVQTPSAERVAFGPFEFDGGSRQLRENGVKVRLRPRELDILEVLIGRAGTFVSDDELMERVWRNQSVNEISLRVQMAGLQRVLGEDSEAFSQGKLVRAPYIQFKRGRGYRFDSAKYGANHVPAPGEPKIKADNLPQRHKPLFGREAALSQLKKVLNRERLVTIVADGGTGKTALAIAVAEELRGTYPDGVWLVDLASVNDGDLVVEAVTATLNIPAIASTRKAELTKWLADKNVLLLLDNCEQVRDSVNRLVTDLLRDAIGVRFLATSRIPLGLAEECAFPLAPLAVPPSMAFTADIALTFPAVAFFIDSLRSHDRTLDLTIENVRLIIELCQSLNGNPLAIELAAAQMSLLGSASLAQRADALATVALDIAAIWRRQDTGLATLEWSYGGLSDKAQLLLARLSACRREFTQATALAIARDDQLSDAEILAGLAELTRTSLISVGESVDPILYHMLVLVRDFGFTRLRTHDDYNDVMRRHANNCLEQLRHSGTDAPDQSNAASLDDIRAAVDWCFSEQGDALTGMRLISLTVGNRKTLYGLQDYARLLDRALTRYNELKVVEPDLELRLIVERMCVNQHGTNDVDMMAKLNARAFELAQASFAETGDPADLLAIHQNAFSLSFGEGNGPEKKHYARELERLIEATGASPEIEILSARMSAQAHHFMGEHHHAVPIIRKVIAMSDAQVRRRVSVPGDRVDPRITLAIYNARSSWLMGAPETATEEATRLVETVRANWDYILCYVIAFCALPIAIWRGDIPGARAHLQDLQTRALDFNLDYWANWGECYARALAFFESGALRPVSFSEDLLPNNLQTDMLATFHEGLLMPLATSRVEAGLVGWCAPEVLRNGADRALAAGTLTATDAEADLLSALKMAVAQDALGWQLRTVTSLGRLWRYQRKAPDARDLLTATMGKFSEGFGDTDFVTASALLKDI